MARPFTVADSKYADELIKLGFSDRLITTPEDCKRYVEHCNKYNMKFLKGSYGTLVHKNFEKYFEYIDGSDEEYEIKQKLSCRKGLDGDYRIPEVSLVLDHVNLFKSKMEEEVYVLTSSPYGPLDSTILTNLKNYPYGAYVIHPNLLDYYGFVGRFDNKLRNPLWDINYAFTNATLDQIRNIVKEVDEGTGIFLSFLPLR